MQSATITADIQLHAGSSVASVEAIRAQFPALERQHNGLPVAYFDGPGGTQTPRSVVEAVIDYLYRHNANTHWNYPTSGETDQLLLDARSAFADFLGGAPEEIVFGANATSLGFHVSRALAQQIGRSDEVVITELDHHANVGPWQALAKESGCTVRVVKMNTETSSLDWNDFEQKTNTRTKLIAVGAASNALGTISDVKHAAQLARSVGALVFVDAVHYAPHNLVDVLEIACDFLVCSAYKFYGPHVARCGAGVKCWSRCRLPRCSRRRMLGRNGPKLVLSITKGIVGAAAAVDFLASLAKGSSRRKQLETAMKVMHAQGDALTQQMWEGLAAIPGVKLYGPQPDAPRTSTVAFTIDGVPSSEVARRLADRGVFVSHGNFYAATVIERLGLGSEGLVRAGCACYTTSEEVERLVAGVRELA